MGDFGYCWGYALIGIGLFGALIGWIARSFTKADDPDMKIYVPCRERNKCLNISNEGLAAVLRVMVAIGNIKNAADQDYIREAADRLEGGKI